MFIFSFLPPRPLLLALPDVKGSHDSCRKPGFWVLSRGCLNNWTSLNRTAWILVGSKSQTTKTWWEARQVKPSPQRNWHPESAPRRRGGIWDESHVDDAIRMRMRVIMRFYFLRCSSPAIKMRLTVEYEILFSKMFFTSRASRGSQAAAIFSSLGENR